jgi:outer membrane protein assembly factor BamA
MDFFRFILPLTFLLLVFTGRTLYAQPEKEQGVGEETVKEDSVAAEVTDTHEAHDSKARFFAIPLVYYTPDTRWRLGAFGVYYFHLRSATGKSETRLSHIKLSSDYTQNNQFDISSSWNIFFRDEAFLLKGKARYRKYPDWFFGIGNRTPESNRERFEYEYMLFKLLAMKKFNSWLASGPVFIGPDIQYTYAYDGEFSPEGELIHGHVTGSGGGLNSGAGLVFLIDHRDNVVNATQGTYLEASIYSFTPLLGGDFSYRNFNLVYSQYFRIFGTLENIHVLALNAVATLNAGDPPFINLAAAGNDDILRGYARYRYRDKHFLAAQAEYRFPIWWRIGGVVFTGIGDVFSKPEQVTWGSLKYSYGGGLRFMLSRRERLNLRLDYGFGRNNSSFYISVTEAF